MCWARHPANKALFLFVPFVPCALIGMPMRDPFCLPMNQLGKVIGLDLPVALQRDERDAGQPKRAPHRVTGKRKEQNERMYNL